MGNQQQKSLAIQLCGAAVKKLAEGQPAPDDISEAASQTSPIFTGKQNRMIILALDYPGTSCPLTCTVDGDNMERLARQCGVQDLVYLKNNECTKERVLEAIADVGSRCEEGDFFIFNYSGHGANVVDKDGDEDDDGKDEALCLVTEDGQLDWSKFLIDDDFAEAVCDAIEDEGVNILIMCDCCHSGTIGDFTDPVWGNRKAISMSGCKDDQTSGDTGNGGIWTHGLLLAIEQMKQDGNDDYSVGQLYNVQRDKDDNVFHSKQDIELKCTSAVSDFDDMAWPLVPPGASYQAPYTGRHS